MQLVKIKSALASAQKHCIDMVTIPSPSGACPRTLANGATLLECIGLEMVASSIYSSLNEAVLRTIVLAPASKKEGKEGDPDFPKQTAIYLLEVCDVIWTACPVHLSALSPSLCIRALLGSPH